MLMVFLYYHFDVHEIYSEVPAFTYDINNLCPVSFFLSLTRGLPILLMFSENQLLGSLVFLIDFLFSMSLTYALIFTILFLFGVNLLFFF